MVGLWFGLSQPTRSNTERVLEQATKTEIEHYLENQDLSYLEDEVSQNTLTNKANNPKILDGLQVSNDEIIEHLKNQDLPENI